MTDEATTQTMSEAAQKRLSAQIADALLHRCGAYEAEGYPVGVVQAGLLKAALQSLVNTEGKDGATAWLRQFADEYEAEEAPRAH